MFSEKRTEFSEILAFSLNEWMCLGYFGLILFEKNKIKCFHNFQCNVCVRVEKFKIDNEKKRKKKFTNKEKVWWIDIDIEWMHTHKTGKNKKYKCQVCMSLYEAKTGDDDDEFKKQFDNFEKEIKLITNFII